MICAPGPWLIAGFLALAAALHAWVESVGGPEVLVERSGAAAPAVMIAVQAALSAAPFPSELFALVSAAAYGWLAGAAITWAGWTIGSMIQYGLARRGATDLAPADLEARLAKLPAWLRRLPVTHPAFLIAVRWLPMGFHLANVVAGARRVPAHRQLCIAAIGSVPGAALWAGIGAGVSLL